MFAKIQHQLSPALYLNLSIDRILVKSAVLLILLSTIVETGALAWGQDNPDFEMGTKAFGVYNLGNIDATTISNGQTSVYIPLISYKQRGAHPPLELGLLYYNNGFSADWNCQTVGGFVFQGIINPPVGAICTGTISNPVPTGFNHGFQPVIKGAIPNGGLGLSCSGSVPDIHGNYTVFSCSSAVTEWDGSTHQMAAASNSTWLAVDGSGYRLDIAGGVNNSVLENSVGFGITNGTLTDPNGIRTWFDPTSTLVDTRIFREDANGNRITHESFNQGYGVNTGYTDTMGRFIPDFFTAELTAIEDYLNGVTSFDTSGCTGPQPISFAFTWTLPGPDGGTYPIKFCYVGATEQVPAIPVPTGPIQMPPVATSNLQSIVLPNGSAWTFQYTADNFNDLAEVTLPIGGILSYTWTSPQQWAPGAPFAPPFVITRGVATRTLDPHDGFTSPSKTTYTYAIAANNAITVTDPAGNDTVHTFTRYAFSPYETQVQMFQGASSAGHVLRTINKEYSFMSQVNGFQDTASIALTAETTILENGQQKRTEYDYDINQLTFFAGMSGFHWQTSYDQNGNFLTSRNLQSPGRYKKQFATREYDYGSGQHGPLLRQQVTAYVFESAAGQGPCPYFLQPQAPAYSMAYLNNNLLNLTGATQVQDGNCNVMAQTTFGYDEANLQPSSITEQLTSNPPAGVLRGNLTSATKINAGGPISTHTNWYDTGEVYQKIDALGNATTISYDPAYFGAYATKTCNALNQCKSGTYDFNTGLLTSFMDFNSQITEYSYDSMARIHQITWPAQVVNGTAIAGKSTFTYNDTPGSLSIQRTDQQDGSTSITNTQFFDGLGRLTGSQLNDPEGNIFSNTTYDMMGRVSTVTNPYRSTSDTTYGVTRKQYDTLGRVLSVTRPDGSVASSSYSGRATQVQDEGNGTRNVTHISQSDALGRPTSICEVTNVTQAGPSGQNAPAACGQDIAANGFLTSYQYDVLGNLTLVQQSGMQRSFQYDSLSRLLQATNPESGTTSYQYDANSNLISRSRPAPNQPSPTVLVTTNYGYDKLNRLTSVSYSDNVTPSVTKKYDTASELGISLNNTIGRLSAEYVTSPGGQLLSGRVYSYDPMGRVTNNSQCVPGSCSSSPSSITYSYDLLGKPLSATNGQGVTFGYGYDAAGRLVTMTSTLSDGNHPGTLFSGASYSALGSLTGATVGSSLNETLAYDCRGRLVSYGSALVPNTATAPAVTNSGCPVPVATGPQSSPTEFFAISPSFRSQVAGLGMENPPAWNGPRLLSSDLGFNPRIPVLSPTNLLATRSGAVFLTRVGKPDLREQGTVTITLRSEDRTRGPQTVSVSYNAKDDPTRVAKKLKQRINGKRDLWVRAKVSRSGATTSLELASRNPHDAAWFVSASVNSNQPNAAIRADVPAITNGSADLLTLVHPRSGGGQ